jgi:integrase
MRVRESSQNTYASSLHRYITFWQTQVGKTLEEILPETGIRTGELHLFLSYASAKYKYNTIASTVSALIDWHKDKGVAYTALSCKRTKDLLNTIKAEQGPAGMPAGKTGMTKAILHLLLKHIHTQRTTDPLMRHLYLRDFCWVLLGFFGMLRRSEIIALQIGDVSIAQQANSLAPYIEVTIRRSKNDRRGEGATVTIAGVSRDGLRIAQTLQEWLALRQRQGASPTDPLFTTWDLDRYYISTQAITNAETLNKRLRHYLSALIAHYPDLPVNPRTYGMHSLRRGGVMAAWKAGIDVEKIKAHGRWKSDAIRAYLNTTPEIRLMVTTAM